MLLSESKNYPLWEGAFKQLNSNEVNAIVSDEKTQLFYEGTNTDFYPEICVLGIFMESNKNLLAVSFRYDVSQEVINNLDYETSPTLDGFTIVNEKEKKYIENLNQKS